MRAARALSRWWAEEFAEPDPLEAPPYPRATKARPGRVAKAVDIDKLVAAERSGSPTAVRDVAILRLLQLTGCRRGEASKLRLDDLDFEGDRINLP